MSFSMDKALHRLLEKEPFFAHFLLQHKIVLDPPKLPTLGVMVDRSGTLILMVNTTFYNGMTTSEQVAILKHELMHVLLGHVHKRGTAYKINHQLANVAMDCAINQHIEGLPTTAITLKVMQENYGLSMKSNQTFEYYFDAIRESPNVQHVEDTTGHDFGDGAMDEMGSTQASAAIAKAAQDAMRASKGNVPQHLQQALGDLLKPAKVPWERHLRNLIASAPIVEKRNTRKKVHRRFDLEQPGKKKKRKPKIAVCVDSSGSVSNEAFNAFIVEAIGISKSCAVMWLLDADSEVQHVKKITGKAKPSELNKRHGNGGTAYQPAITKAMSLKVDIIIYFGDMDSADHPTNPRIPFIWARVGSQEPPGKFGHVVDVPL